MIPQKKKRALIHDIHLLQRLYKDVIRHLLNTTFWLTTITTTTNLPSTCWASYLWKIQPVPPKNSFLIGNHLGVIMNFKLSYTPKSVVLKKKPLTAVGIDRVDYYSVAGFFQNGLSFLNLLNNFLMMNYGCNLLCHTQRVMNLGRKKKKAMKIYNCVYYQSSSLRLTKQKHRNMSKMKHFRNLKWTSLGRITE